MLSGNEAGHLSSFFRINFLAEAAVNPVNVSTSAGQPSHTVYVACGHASARDPTFLGVGDPPIVLYVYAGKLRPPLIYLL